MDFKRLKELSDFMDRIRQEHGEPIWTYQCNFGCRSFDYCSKLNPHLMRCDCATTYHPKEHSHYASGRTCSAPMKLVSRNRAAEEMDKWHAKKKDQRTAAEKAVSAVTKLEEMLPSDRFIEQLEFLVGEQQNRPPLGEADGTIGEKNWTLLRDLTESLKKASFLVKHLKKKEDLTE